MKLRDAFRLHPLPRLALTGSGGKTSALFQLAGEWDGPVLLTTTTHLSVEQAQRASHHWMVKDPRELVERETDLLQPGSTLITSAEGADGRTPGASVEVLAALVEIADTYGLPLLVEADGSRMLPLKVPAEHEPAVPVWADTVVVVAGLSALGRPLTAEWVHRPERFAALADAPLGSPISAEMIARVLVSSQGGMKGIPPGARRIALLNQADTPEQAAAAAEIAALLQQHYDAVVCASLQHGRVEAVYERACAVILAAGKSERFGAPKVLLDWSGKPLVRRSAEGALQAGLETVVVTGAHDREIRAALEGLPVQIVANTRWEEGQSTSLQAGLAAVGNAGSVIFLLADQPFASAEVLHALLDAHQRTLAPVIAPRVNGRRANPVLFDQVTFTDLENVRGDQGGRAVMTHWPVTYVDVDDARLLVDIDTPEDYRRLLEAGDE